MSKPAYVWRRNLTADQMRKVGAVRSLREEAFSAETIAGCSFARCQLRQPSDLRPHFTPASGTWKRKSVSFEFEFRPLFVEYAIAVYERVLADALAYYPAFNEFEVVDGPLVGERRLVFPAMLDEAAAWWMQSRAWWVMEHTDVAVAESCEVTRTKGVPAEATARLVIDRPAITHEIGSELVETITKGQAVPIDPTPRKCDPNLTIQLFAELSLPELVLLNWPQVCKPPTAADRRLHAAIESLDLEGVRAALDAGADPNSTFGDTFAMTALAKTCETEIWREQMRGSASSGHPPDAPPKPDAEMRIRMIDLLLEAGAALDWAPPNELTPLALAALDADAAVVRHLVDRGADPSIRCDSDDHENAWGTAWEFAHFRCDPVADNDDRSAWEALTSRWPEPFGGW